MRNQMADWKNSLMRSAHRAENRKQQSKGFQQSVNIHTLELRVRCMASLKSWSSHSLGYSNFWMQNVSIAKYSMWTIPFDEAQHKCTHLSLVQIYIRRIQTIFNGFYRTIRLVLLHFLRFYPSSVHRLSRNLYLSVDMHICNVLVLVHGIASHRIDYQRHMREWDGNLLDLSTNCWLLLFHFWCYDK